MSKKRIFVLISLLLLLAGVFLSNAIKEAKELRRDPVVLLNQYYTLKESHPMAAQKALRLILNQDHHHLIALKELSQWFIRQGQLTKALPLLEQLHVLLPESHAYTLQLAYVYYLNNDWDKAKPLYLALSRQTEAKQKTDAMQGLNAMASYLPFYQYHATTETWMVAINDAQNTPSTIPSSIPITPKVNTRQKAPPNPATPSGPKHSQAPNEIQTLKEAGFAAATQGRCVEAIAYLRRAYEQRPEPEIAMQLAYLYDQINNKPMAYRYFRLATKSNDHALFLRAENALTDLAGQQTKALPAPYFSEFYFNPFTQSRFGLTVKPLIWRAGIEQDNPYQTKEYLFLRRTSDNRSENLGEVSQIYEDNVQITGVGAQITPIKGLPMIGFVEVGEAYDLIYQHRNRWRGDLRGGLMFYREFGPKPTYFDNLTFSTKYYNDWYGDITYFSRYNNNVIGLVRTHQGIRLLQYHSTMINAYITGRVIADTQREFFNNIAEIGPGIAFIPSNHLNVQLRFEQVRGAYLPSVGFNPYGKYYTNRLVQLLFYVKI